MRFKKIYIEITNSCNLSCSFCAINNRPVHFMEEFEFIQILDEIAPFTKYIYLHVLGEPLLHPKLARFLVLAHERGFFVNLTTNGTLLVRCLDVLLEHPVRQINVSLHNFKEQDGIVMEDYLADIIACAKALSATTYISLRLWCANQGVFDDTTLELVETLATYFPEATKLFGEKSSVTLVPRIFLHREEVFVWPSMQHQRAGEGRCLGMVDQLAILSSGQVTACCLDGHGVMDFGNIFTQSLTSILSTKRVQALLEGFSRRTCSEGLCQRCTFKHRFDRKEDNNERT
ncbi:MAG: radical SAM/SPASM domain-containing protein [Erysipelotrichaceae bacterium]